MAVIPGANDYVFIPICAVVKGKVGVASVFESALLGLGLCQWENEVGARRLFAGGAVTRYLAVQTQIINTVTAVIPTLLGQ